jgi:hypothetical protein
MDHKNKRKTSWDSKVSNFCMRGIACSNCLLSSIGIVLIIANSFPLDIMLFFWTPRSIEDGPETKGRKTEGKNIEKSLHKHSP